MIQCIFFDINILYGFLNPKQFKLNYLETSLIATATATEAPTIGLLSIPINPIISTTV